MGNLQVPGPVRGARKLNVRSRVPAFGQGWPTCPLPSSKSQSENALSASQALTFYSGLCSDKHSQAWRFLFSFRFFFWPKGPQLQQGTHIAVHNLTSLLKDAGSWAPSWRFWFYSSVLFLLTHLWVFSGVHSDLGPSAFGLKASAASTSHMAFPHRAVCGQHLPPLPREKCAF